MTRDYPAYRKDLQSLIGRLRKRAPGPLTAFAKLHEESMKPGALDEKHKELIALAIGVASRCDGCISFHTHEALTHGASPAEIAETLGVAVMMGGGPTLMYAAHAVEALEQYEGALEMPRAA